VEGIDIKRHDLREFLLGRLSADRKAAVESAFLTSETIHEELLVVEEELFEEYRHNEFSPEDRRGFEDRLSRSVVWQDRIAFERALKQGAEIRRVKSPVTLPAWRQILDAIADTFARPQVKWAGAFVSLFLVAVLVRSLWFGDRAENVLFSDMTLQYESGTTGTRGEYRDTHGEDSSQVTPAGALPVLTESDQYALRMKIDEQVYLYVVQWDTSGNGSVLFPNSETSDDRNPVPAQTEFRLPRSPGWLAVEKDPGIETIGLIASKEPRADLERELEILRNGTYVQKMEALVRIRGGIELAELGQNEGLAGCRLSFVYKKTM
jgi:hypothetical protein